MASRHTKRSLAQTAYPARRPAMTLVELVVSLAIVSMIVAACGSMVLVAGKALSNDASNPGSDAVAARAAVSMIVDDLKTATSLSEQSTTAITMNVPDRDGDGAEEVIRYAWTGTPGDPLTRTYNTRAAGVVVTNVRALNLGYLSKTVGKPPPVESAEQTHSAVVASASLGDDTMTTTSWSSAYFKPTLPANSTKWKVSRVRVQIKKKGTAVGNLVVSVRYGGSDYFPTGSDLMSGTASIPNIGLDATIWLDVIFSSPPDLDVTKPVCVLVRTNAASEIARLCYYTGSTDNTLKYSKSTNSGSSWSAPTAGQAMQAVITGTVTTQEEDTYAFQPLPAALP